MGSESADGRFLSFFLFLYHNKLKTIWRTGVGMSIYAYNTQFLNLFDTHVVCPPSCITSNVYLQCFMTLKMCFRAKRCFVCPPYICNSFIFCLLPSPFHLSLSSMSLWESYSLERFTKVQLPFHPEKVQINLKSKC